jgi:hypothetical protein
MGEQLPFMLPQDSGAHRSPHNTFPAASQSQTLGDFIFRHPILNYENSSKAKKPRSILTGHHFHSLVYIVVAIVPKDVRHFAFIYVDIFLPPTAGIVKSL